MVVGETTVGKGGDTNGVSPEIQQGELNNSNQLVALAQQQGANSQQLYNASFPGFQQAENFYSTIATGDPGKIAAATAPAVQQIDAATTSAKQNILNNSPNGGEKNLALEQADVARGAKVGDVTSQGYLNSFNALASLAGQGVGEGISSAGTGISGFNSANSGLGQIGQQQIQQQQLQQQAKGATLGAVGGLAGDVASAAGEAGSFGALFAGI